MDKKCLKEQILKELGELQYCTLISWSRYMNITEGLFISKGTSPEIIFGAIADFVVRSYSRKYKRKIEIIQLLKLIADKPYLSSRELAKYFDCSNEAVLQILKRVGKYIALELSNQK